MDDVVRFATDLYRGSAGYYDRYRLPYPEAMLADLVQRAPPQLGASMTEPPHSGINPNREGLGPRISSGN